jgi:hypothetical protein
LLLLLTVGIAKSMPTDDSPAATSRRHADSTKHHRAG